MQRSFVSQFLFNFDFTAVSFAFCRWQRLQMMFLAWGLITVTSASPVLAQENTREFQTLVNRTITVTGRGVEMIPTTLTQVRLGVEVQGKTAQEVQQEATRRSSAVVALLREAKLLPSGESRQVEKLETTGISLNPVYSYNNNVQQLTGYSATNIVSFRLNTERIGNLLDAAVKAGATRIDSISFVAADSAIAAAQKQALRLATQDAQQQANTVLSTLNLTAKEVVNIQVNGAVPPQPPIPLANQTAIAEKRDIPTPIVGGEQQVEASVTLQISY